MPNPNFIDTLMHHCSLPGRSRLKAGCSALLMASVLPWLFGLVGCSSTDAVTSKSVAPEPSTIGRNDPLTDVPDDFELEIKVLVGGKVTDQDVLERRDVHMVLFPDGTLHAASGDMVVPGARPGLARTLLRGQVADAWALLGRLDLREAGASPTRPVRAPGQAEIVHIIEITANGERRRSVTRFVGSCSDSVSTTLVRSIGGLAWLTDTPAAGNDIIPLRYDFGPDPWGRYRRMSNSK